MVLMTLLYFQQSDVFSLIVLIGVFGFIAVAFVITTIDNNKQEKEKNVWLRDNQDKLKILDDIILKLLKPLIQQVPKCNKCETSLYRIWEVTSTDMKIRCNDCKKIYSIELNENSSGVLECLSDYIDFVQNAYSNPNEKLREHLIKKLTYDFTQLRAGQPFIRAMSFESKSKKIAPSTKLPVKLIGYSDYLTFNQNEYYENMEISFNDLKNFPELEDNHRFEISNAFDEHPEADQITFQLPPFTFSIQKEVTIYRNEIPLGNNLVSQLKTEKRSRRISQKVKDKVWRRDEGKCVECGSNENLEFDHIIPFSKGGANTYRNIQLLCQNCNRSKSNKIE